MNKDINKILINNLSKTNNLEVKQVNEIINSPFNFIRSITKDLNFDNIKTEEEFNKLKKNFNIPKIGKLYANFYNLKHIRNVRRHK